MVYGSAAVANMFLLIAILSVSTQSPLLII